jgi:hypothetical protein
LPPGTPVIPGVTPGTSPTSAPPAAGNACDVCTGFAQAGNTLAAATAYAQCASPGGKASCTSRLGNKAGAEAERAVLNGDCDKARKILKAAQDMGVQANRLTKGQAAVAGCK